jgi:hypothetical protein
MRIRPKNPARDSPTIVPFGCASDECGLGVEVEVGAGTTKEGSELGEGKGVGVSDVWLRSDMMSALESLACHSVPTSRLH